MAAELPSRELRHDTRGVLRRVEAGERLTVTLAGKPVAILAPTRASRRWMPRGEFLGLLQGHQADPGLRDDRAELVTETTDDLPFE